MKKMLGMFLALALVGSTVALADDTKPPKGKSAAKGHKGGKKSKKGSGGTTTPPPK